MAQLPMTLREAEGHFCVSDLCSTPKSGNIACFNYSALTYKLESTHGL